MNPFLILIMILVIISFVVYALIFQRTFEIFDEKFTTPEVIPFKINFADKKVTLLNKYRLFENEVHHSYEDFVERFSAKSRSSINKIINSLNEKYNESKNKKVDASDFIAKRSEVKLVINKKENSYYMLFQNVIEETNEICGYLRYEPISGTSAEYNHKTDIDNVVPDKDFDERIIELTKDKKHTKHSLSLFKIEGMDKLSDSFDVNVAAAIRRETFRNIAEAIGKKGVMSITPDGQIWMYKPCNWTNKNARKKAVAKIYKRLNNLTLDGAIKVQIRLVAGMATIEEPLKKTVIKNLKSLALFCLIKANAADVDFRMFDETDSPEYAKKKELVKNIENTLKKNDIEVNYQPMHSLTTGRLAGFTTTSKLKGINVPFHAIEELTNIYIGSTLFNNTLIKAIISTTYESKESIYINISASTIFNNFKSFEDVFKMVNVKKHVFELTNTRELSTYQLRELCKLLYERKIRYCIDNYDMNQDSIASVAQYAPESIKISKLTQNIHINDQHMIEAIDYVKFCHKQDIKVIATKVENEYELYLLSKIGVDAAEGYYIGKPSNEAAKAPKEIIKQILEYKEA